jgi:hypothetical protein
MTANEIAFSDRAGSATSTDGTRAGSAPGVRVGDELGATDPSVQISTMPTLTENVDPGRRRVRNPRRGFVYRVVRFVRSLLWPELTAEDRAKLSEKEARKLLEKSLNADAKTAEGRMIKRLKGMGICHEYRRRDGGFDRYALVKFDRVAYEPNAIWFRVDINKLPFGVSTEQLKSKEVVDNLGMAVGHAVRCDWSVERGLWYVVERASGAMGIPNHVRLVDLWQRMPSSKDSLTIPIGLTSNSRPIFESISAMTHILVAGSTNSGKSNFMNMLICTLIRYNSPSKLQMMLVDLKGGMEFSFYKGLPHLIKLPKIAPEGIVYERDDVLAMLRWLVMEGERRMKMMTDAKAKNIGKYNAHRKHNILPWILVVIDEWADIMYSKQKKETETALVNLVQRMRAVGIHVVVCTQYPKKEVLTGLVKGNLPAKFAFSTTNNAGSINILDHGMAAHLHPEGRCVFQWREDMVVQTPYIPDALVNEIVAGAIEGKMVDVKTNHDVTPEEVLNWALANNNGNLQSKILYPKFKERGVARDELEVWLHDWTGKEFVLGSTVYTISEPSGKIPRRLLAIEHKQDDEPDAPETSHPEPVVP